MLGVHKALLSGKLSTNASLLCVQLEEDGVNGSQSTAQQQYCPAVPIEFMTSSTIVVGDMVKNVVMRPCSLVGNTVPYGPL